MDRDWKGEGTVPSPAKQLKMIFLGPKSSSGKEWLGAQNYAQNQSCQNGVKPKGMHISHCPESDTTHFKWNRHHILLECVLSIFSNRQNKLQSADWAAHYASIHLTVQVIRLIWQADCTSSENSVVLSGILSAVQVVSYCVVNVFLWWPIKSCHVEARGPPKWCKGPDEGRGGWTRDLPTLNTTNLLTYHVRWVLTYQGRKLYLRWCHIQFGGGGWGLAPTLGHHRRWDDWTKASPKPPPI